MKNVFKRRQRGDASLCPLVLCALQIAILISKSPFPSLGAGFSLARTHQHRIPSTCWLGYADAQEAVGTRHALVLTE
jgi:hypothetical protein